MSSLPEIDEKEVVLHTSQPVAEVGPPPILRVRYRKGDLIIKQGVYGISIYKILRGKVVILREDGDREVPLATLGPGEIIGEMTFLNQSAEPRSASARALETCELEVWHPDLLSKEYDRMPIIIKYIADQLLERLDRTNKLIARLSLVLRETTGSKPKEPKDSQRMYYRKELNLACTYRPVEAPPKVNLPGKIKNLSMGGVGMEVSSRNALNFSHEIGDLLHVSTVLPNKKEVEFTGKIVSIRKDKVPGLLSLGIAFVNISEHSRKNLGFFMMP